jgi:3',5'-cyclic AMP phosphodiesterase CpdA
MSNLCPRYALALALLVSSSGCSDESKVVLIPPDGRMTDEVTWLTVHERFASPDSRDPRNANHRAAMLAEGLGDEYQADGEPHIPRAEDGEPPAPGAEARMLVRFAHLADMQITDDESPTRLAQADAPVFTSSAFRAQDYISCQLSNAMVRSLNAVNEKLPLDFVVLGGDNLDSAQSNELEWVLTVLNGGDLECDSGLDDDLVNGPDNDPKDPFTAEGLDVPWYWVMGNHDILVQGNMEIAEEVIARAIGNDAPFGTRLFTDDPTGPVYAGEIAPDSRRMPLYRNELIAEVAASGNGHGIDLDTIQRDMANYAIDVEGTPIRILVVDTACETGGAEGLIRRADLDEVIVPLLDAAYDDGKVVIVTSHHGPASIANGDVFFGTLQEDAVPPEEWIEVLTSHPAVFFALVAHSHENKIIRLDGLRPIWVVYTAAVLDYPHQSRVLELWDDDNDFLRVRMTMVDLAFQDDPIAADGRRLGVMERTIRWTDEGRGTAQDRNVELFIPKPDHVL